MEMDQKDKILKAKNWDFFEYKVLKTCEYGVYSKYDPYNNYTRECGEPAVACVRWSEKENWFYLCEKHFEYVMKCEEEND